jgi:hypothetical protein
MRYQAAAQNEISDAGVPNQEYFHWPFKILNFNSFLFHEDSKWSSYQTSQIREQFFRI